MNKELGELYKELGRLSSYIKHGEYEFYYMYKGMLENELMYHKANMDFPPDDIIKFSNFAKVVFNMCEGD
ncbi:hypothetical protein [Klebsiella quasivariicola]|uniref:hypothetical protein n=1 Tax=Klebsiella quasivariicola TaxID=2026240 RepID=UPI00247B0E78|nr:hypothetical protein [Klebsiella quasivariicola]